MSMHDVLTDARVGKVLQYDVAHIMVELLVPVEVGMIIAPPHSKYWVCPADHLRRRTIHVAERLHKALKPLKPSQPVVKWSTLVKSFLFLHCSQKPGRAAGRCV